MPSRSKTQQRLMGQAYAYKTGDLKAKDLNPDYADEIKKLSKSMTQKQLKDFAGTKHKGLPEKVEEKIKKFNSFNESFNDESPVKVKHLIEYLKKFDPEMSVQLDKDGWEHEDNPLDTIEYSGLFDQFRNTLFINN